MKKLVRLFISFCILLTLPGCTAGDIFTDNTSSIADTTTANNTSSPPKPRVYMDEIKGTLQDFTGSTLTIISQEQTYIFDLSETTIECKNGMISGDEISVIYEGQLSDDASTVKALKVTDDFQQENQLEIRKAYGEVQNITPNTITIKNKKGKTATYPITGTQQYYQNGIHTGIWVYIYFKGKFVSTGSEQNGTLNASHLKVLSISDIDPFVFPEPTPTPEPSQNSADDAPPEQSLHATIQSLSQNTLTVRPSGTDTSLNVDISQIPTAFKGGAAPGSYITLTYKGQYNGNSLEGITITAVTGDDPDSLNSRSLSYTVSGTIVGHTANTVTIQTSDGAYITCFTEGAKDTSTSNLEFGAGIQITFDPSKSKESNIYTSVRIQDA